MTRRRDTADNRMALLFDQLDRLDIGDMAWILGWLAGAEPAVFEEALRRRRQAVLASGPGAGTTYDDDKGNELQVPG